MRPGSDPVGALAQALSPALSLSIAEVERTLRESPAALSELAGERGLLLFIDQMEELITLEGDQRSGAHRMDALLRTALEERPGHVLLVSTLRSDFSRLLHELPGLASILTGVSRYHLEPMNLAALLNAITRPALVGGLAFEPGLPERIAGDALEAEAALPLLAHALRELWRARSGALLTGATYERVGGVGRALVASADHLISSLGEIGRDRARRLLLCLVKSGRGAEDTRRIVTREDALAAAGGDDEAERVLGRLSGARGTGGLEDASSPVRLLVLSGAAAQPAGQHRVELAHEALIRHWHTLGAWIEEARKRIERRDDLESAAEAWEAAGCPEVGLPVGSLRAYYEGVGLAAAAGEQFTDLSSARARRFLASAAALEDRGRLETEARARERARRNRWTVALALSLVAMITGLAIAAFVERAQAERRLNEALSVADQISVELNDKLLPVASSLPLRLELLAAHARLLDRIVEGAEANPLVEHAQMLSHYARGVVALEKNDLEVAREEYQTAVRLGSKLIASTATSAETRRYLAMSQQELAGVAYLSGRIDEARAWSLEAAGHMRIVLEERPGDVAARRDLAETWIFLAQLARVSGSLMESRRLLERAEALDPPGERTMPVLYNRLSDVARLTGDLGGAWRAHQRAIDLLEARLNAVPEDTWARAELGRAYNRRGILLLRLGRLEEAREAFEKSLRNQLRLRKTADSSDVRRSVLTEHGHLGRLALRLGRREEAHEAMVNALEIAEELSEQDPKNARHRQSVEECRRDLGDWAKSAGDLGEARAKYLAYRDAMAAAVTADPSASPARRALAEAEERLAELSVRSGELAAAHLAYRSALDLREARIAKDPEDTDAEQELAGSLERLGALAFKEADLPAAEKYWTRADQILRALTERDPKNAEWRRDRARLSLDLHRLGRRRGDRAEARRRLSEARELLAALSSEGSPKGGPDPKSGANAPQGLFRGDVEVAELVRQARDLRD